MPVDSSIALGVRPFQMPDQVNQLAKVLQIQSMQDEAGMNRLKMQEYQRGVSEQNALAKLMSDPGMYKDGKLDTTALTPKIYAAAPTKAATVLKGLAEQRKADADFDKTQLETTLKGLEHVGSVLQGVKDPTGYAAARLNIGQVLGPQWAARLPEQYDPAFVQDGARLGMTAAKAMEEARQRQKAAQDAANDPFRAGANGESVPNVPVQQYQLGKAKAGATNVTLNTEKSYAGNIAEGLAKQDLAIIDAARSAPERIANAQRVKKILDTQSPITGTGAEARLAFNKALATAGLIDGQSVKSTEDLASILASSTLDAIKTSGLGSGQGFTDKDRQFLERAKSGNIEINGGTLRTLADMNERAARASIDAGGKVATRLKGNPSMGSVGQDFNFTQPPEYKGPSVVVKPPAQGGSQVRFLGFE